MCWGLFLSHLFLRYCWAVNAVVCVNVLIRRGHRGGGSFLTTQRSMLTHSGCCSFPWCRRNTLRDEKGKGCTSPWTRCQRGSLKRSSDAEEKVYKAAFIWVERGRWGGTRGSSGSCVIVSLLIKVMGVSWIIRLCHTVLLDICCLQVEEMFRLLGGFDHILSQINTLQFDRCAHH